MTDGGDTCTSTTTTSTNIYIYKYVQAPINLKGADPIWLADDLRREIEGLRCSGPTSPAGYTFQLVQRAPINVDPTLLDEANSEYTEKFVEGIGKVFPSYAQGFKPSMHSTIPARFRRKIPRELRPLITKYFSGDVSGNLAESLFAYLAVNYCKLNQKLVKHLRPHKNRGEKTADFLVLDKTSAFERLVGFNFDVPFYVEVKGATGSIDKKRIRRGLEQLKTVLELQYKQTGYAYGALFIACRSENLRCYMVFFTGVKHE